MPTLQQITTSIGHALNDLSVPFVASGGTTTTVVLPALANATPNASRHFEDAAWAYNQTQRVTGKVQAGGYDPPTGRLTIDPPWPIPVNGDRIILTRELPILSSALTRESSYQYVASEAARWLWFEHQLPLLTVGGAHAYSLASYGRWLTRRDQFLGLLDPPIVPGYVPQSGTWRRPTLDFAAGVPTLHLRTAYAGSGEPLALGVQCPLAEVVNGVDSAAGMTLESDSVNGDLAELSTVGLWIAYRTLSQGNGPDAAAWGAKAGPQEARARALGHFLDRGAQAEPAVGGVAPSQTAPPRPPATVAAA